MEQKRIQPLARDAMAYVLAGGRGSRLKELTDRRAKPAVHFGGKARIIDFALSNALNSGIRRIGVATQYKAHSLIRHLQRGWNFLRPERNESFDILPASQRVSETQWYEGTADAVYQNIDITVLFETKAAIQQFDNWYLNDIKRVAFFSFRHPRTRQIIQARLPGGKIGELIPAKGGFGISTRTLTLEYMA